MEPIAFIILPGLNTPANSDCHTMRPLVQGWLDNELKGTGSQMLCIEYDRVTVQIVVDFIKSVGPNARVVLIGHSFGGAAAIWLATMLGLLKMLVFLLVAYDPAPNGPLFGQWFNWVQAKKHNDSRWVCPDNVTNGLLFYQDNQILIPEVLGVCGVPFQPDQPRVLNVDCTPWGLKHNDVPADIMTHELTTSKLISLI